MFEDNDGDPFFVSKFSNISDKDYIWIERNNEVTWYNPLTDRYWQDFSEFDKDGNFNSEKWLSQNNWIIYDSMIISNHEISLHYTIKNDLRSDSLKSRYIDYDIWFNEGKEVTL